MLMIVQEKWGKSMNRTGWTINDELNFVAHLRKVGKKSLLEGYLSGLARRVKWGDIDSVEVECAALRALEGLK